jgi:hypothetical protein
MITALFYLQYHSFRNRLVSRFKRLKQPKYLFGAIAGGLYFYFYFFRYVSGRGQALGALFSGDHQALVESLCALVLFVIVVLAWFIPHERAALTFSEAEVAFLFPAPISRRGLIHFKLMRSQVRILFTTLFLTLMFRPSGHPLMRATGWWLILSTLNLHFLGCSFARTMLLDRGIANWLRRLAVFLVTLGLVGFVLVWARRTMPELTSADLSDHNSMLDYAQRVLISGPAFYLLYPFRILVQPYLATDALNFFRALAPALLLFLLHYVWVVYSDVAFEEASVEASQKLAARIAAVRSGNWQAAGKKPRKGKRPLFKLAATGPPPVALLWKNLISAGQSFTWRIWIIIVIMAVAMYIGLGKNPHSSELFTGMAIVAGSILGWSLLVGPQLVRQDLRQDLPLADILKLYPMAGWQVVLGEMLAPAVILAGIQWLLLLVATSFLLYAHGLNDGPMPLVIAGSTAMLLPLLDLLVLLIPNAAVLLFPSWIQTGREGPRGIEATGQRLILLLGQVLVFMVALVPTALAFAAVFLVLRFALNPSVAIPFASLAAGAILAVEIGLGVWLLGRWFERFDISAELGP